LVLGPHWGDAIPLSGTMSSSSALTIKSSFGRFFSLNCFAISNRSQTEISRDHLNVITDFFILLAQRIIGK